MLFLWVQGFYSYFSHFCLLVLSSKLFKKNYRQFNFQFLQSKSQNVYLTGSCLSYCSCRKALNVIKPFGWNQCTFSGNFLVSLLEFQLAEGFPLAVRDGITLFVVGSTGQPVYLEPSFNEVPAIKNKFSFPVIICTYFMCRCSKKRIQRSDFRSLV